MSAGNHRRRRNQKRQPSRIRYTGALVGTVREQHEHLFPEDEQVRLRAHRALMTTERREAFGRHRAMFVDRAAELKSRRLTEYVSGDATRRKQFGLGIRDARKALGLRTQRSLAQEAGVNTETISRIENGANVEPTTFAKVFDVLISDTESAESVLLTHDREWFLAALDRIVAEELASGNDVAGALTPEQADLARKWAKLPRELRDQILGMIDYILEHTSTAVESKA